MIRLCFASNNKHKLEEIRQALSDNRRIVGGHVDLLSLNDIKCFEELPETRDTMEGNSLQKASYVFDHYHIPCFADDSGLEVEALKGAPGVYSARYAGAHRSDADNIDLLLKNLYGDTNRRARFRSVITLVGLDEKPVYFEGIIPGTIIAARRGTGGFGYDPVFVPEGHSRTFAEMSLEEKNAMSHRAIAVRKLADYLQGR
ncbi:RdgB/HAM1 family non-canonical purine NTP pyrophosphatase [Dawidia soli]|uniref:dITP/XTP pyrophosphatase n=1 Tax=Dawidia soli TaxID=2782352 RepID=A0AAP2GLE3_9BACT|nr:RdgB/HAM1 family non-canonical purine NTP pyrophosphatase [Dawidia soli]MBT1690023.1 RdgB/HAM1 family non-canonical purine NTP pyrophosphatase [Dawidia soli]